VLPPEEVSASARTARKAQLVGPLHRRSRGRLRVRLVVLGAGPERVAIRGAVVEEPLVPVPPPRCAIAMLAANANNLTRVTARRRYIIGQTLTEACVSQNTPR
jgi:hypothetical protein